MLSKYFMKKTATKQFDDDINGSINELNGKKVVLYGAGDEFVTLAEKYQFDKLDIVAIADMKFKQEEEFMGFKAISPNNIQSFDYDAILITNEYAPTIIKYLKNELMIEDKYIKTIFKEVVKDERGTVNYLEGFKFEDHLKKLEKKLNGKSIVIYGAGIFFEAINLFYNLKDLNIIAISDRRFSTEAPEQEFLGYKTVAPDKIKDLNPDYVLVATKFFINIIEDLDSNVLRKTKIKIKPLIKKPFSVLWKEIWG